MAVSASRTGFTLVIRLLDVRARRADLTSAPASIRATSWRARLTAAGCNTAPSARWTGATLLQVGGESARLAWEAITGTGRAHIASLAWRALSCSSQAAGAGRAGQAGLVGKKCIAPSSAGLALCCTCLADRTRCAGTAAGTTFFTGRPCRALRAVTRRCAAECPSWTGSAASSGFFAVLARSARRTAVSPPRAHPPSCTGGAGRRDVQDEASSRAGEAAFRNRQTAVPKGANIAGCGAEAAECSARAVLTGFVRLGDEAARRTRLTNHGSSITSCSRCTSGAAGCPLDA